MSWTLWLVVAVVLQPGIAWSAGDTAKGKEKYQELCAACHGASGKGDGPAAPALTPKPRDHTDGAYMNKLTDEQVFNIIKSGGAAAGKSPLMPAWGGPPPKLSDQQIQDLVAYIRTLAQSK